MQHNLETLRNALWEQFEIVAAKSTHLMGEEWSKAQAMGTLAVPLLAIENQLAQKQPVPVKTP